MMSPSIFHSALCIHKGKLQVLSLLCQALWLRPKRKTGHYLIVYQQFLRSIFWHTQVALTALTTDSCKDQTKNLTDFNVLVCFVIQLQLLQNRKCLLLNCNEELFGTMG